MKRPAPPSGNTKQPLFAVALERHIRGNEWAPEMHHIHAETREQAEFHFKTINPDRRKVRVVACGAAIGYHVMDKQGMILRA